MLHTQLLQLMAIPKETNNSFGIPLSNKTFEDSNPLEFYPRIIEADDEYLLKAYRSEQYYFWDRCLYVIYGMPYHGHGKQLFFEIIDIKSPI